MNFPAIRQPSAIIPIGLSVAALSAILCHIALHGVAPQADEGTAAHLWQIAMAAQVPVVIFHAVKWLPRTPGAAVRVLTVQAAAALAALLPVYWLGW